MKPAVYSSAFYKGVLQFHKVSLLVVIAFVIYILWFACGFVGRCSTLGVTNSLIDLIFKYGVLAVIIFILPIVIVYIQQRGRLRIGLLIFVSIALEIYLLVRIANEFFKQSILQSGGGTPFLSSGLLFLTLVILLHLYIAVTTIVPRSNMKWGTSIVLCILLAGSVSGGFSHHYVKALKSEEWQTFTNSDCEYEIKYLPRLTYYGSAYRGVCRGITFENKSYGDELSVNVYFSKASSLDEWLKKGWPQQENMSDFEPYFTSGSYRDDYNTEAHDSFYGQYIDRYKDAEPWSEYFERESKKFLSKGEKQTVNGYETIKLPTISYDTRAGQRHSYAVFIFNGKYSVIKTVCSYQNDEMAEICREMISSIKFTR
jgi:hypothetical protein